MGTPALEHVSVASRAVGGRLRRREVGASRTWQAVLVVGAGLVAAYFALPRGVQDLAYSGIGVAATIVMVLVIPRRQPVARRGWYLLAAANALFVLGDGAYLVYDQVLHQDVPFPSAADALYLAGYPFLAAGVWRVGRLRGVRTARETRVDAAMVSIGALALSWQLLMDSYADDATIDTFGKLVTMAYPIMDVGIVFVVVSAMVSGAVRRGAGSLLVAATLVMLVSDLVYDLLVLHSDYTAGDLVDGGFLLNYVLLAAAAAHPGGAEAPAQGGQPPDRRTGRLVLLAVSAFVSPVIVLLSSVFGWHVDADVLAATSIVLIALVAVRASWLFRRLESQTGELMQRELSLQAALMVQLGLQDELRHQAFHDSLTGLANRALLYDRVERALEASVRLTGNVAVCVIDLDGFKGVNDGQGHQLGDRVLLTVAKRLAGIVRGGDTVARLGGDEFAILLENAETFETVTTMAQRIVAVLHEPIDLDGRRITVSASVGVAFAGTDTSTEILLNEADAALYDAKANGKDRFALFETIMRSRILDRTTLINSFQDSLKRADFFVEYQPQVNLSDGMLKGFEALVRWRHPALGLLGPARFIALAEETGFIVRLGRWVLEQACMEAARWPISGGELLTVSVNVSGRQLQDTDLLHDVRTALACSGLPAHRLVLEITESVSSLNQDEITRLLRRLKELGVKLAIDDFGTGYSSLSYLRDLPVDILKIDKSFVDLLQDPASEGTTFVRTILQLAEDLHLDVTAEGIEHPAQLETLARLKCGSAQGHLISPPLSSAAARAFVAAARG